MDMKLHTNITSLFENCCLFLISYIDNLIGSRSRSHIKKKNLYYLEFLYILRADEDIWLIILNDKVEKNPPYIKNSNHNHRIYNHKPWNDWS